MTTRSGRAGVRAAGRARWERFSFVELARRARLPLAEVYAELPDRAALLRALGRRLDAEMLAIEVAELDGHEPARAGVRADHAPPRRHGALQGGPAQLWRGKAGREPTLLAAACCNLEPAQPSPGGCRGIDGRPGHAAGWRGGPRRRSICGPSGSGSTTIRRTWRVPWPSSTAACSRPRAWRGGSLASAGSARYCQSREA